MIKYSNMKVIFLKKIILEELKNTKDHTKH